MSKVFVAGHNGMVGSAIYRRLTSCTDYEIITCSSQQLDLRDQLKTKEFLKKERPDIVILAAARVGGIHANNSYPAQFIYDNIMIQANVIHQAYEADVEKLLFLGSSCIYPKLAQQPMSEGALLTGELEPTNEPYAIAKIAGIKICESYNRQYGVDYRSVMPTNLYGPGDNFHIDNSHVIPALIRRFYEAKLDKTDRVTIWGTGNAKREFLHVDDMASASLFVLNLPKEDYEINTDPMLSHVNVGSGIDITIMDLAKIISSAIGFKGQIETDPSKPDGSPRKLLDVSRLKSMGWESEINLEQGILETQRWFESNIDNYRRSKLPTK